MVYVSSTMHRTFGKADWQQLHSLLLGTELFSKDFDVYLLNFAKFDVISGAYINLFFSLLINFNLFISFRNSMKLCTYI